MLYNVAPVPAPSLAGLAAQGTAKGNLLTWDAPADSSYFTTEVWGGQTNSRATALKLTEITTNYWLHSGITGGQIWYYWIRSRNIFNRADGAWYPVGNGAGVSSSPALSLTADIAPGATISTSIAQFAPIPAVDKAAYGVWETVAAVAFTGTGNPMMMDVLNNFIPVYVIGNTGQAYISNRFLLYNSTLSAPIFDISDGVFRLSLEGGHIVSHSQSFYQRLLATTTVNHNYVLSLDTMNTRSDNTWSMAHRTGLCSFSLVEYKR